MQSINTPWRAVAAAFALNGFLLGTWASRVPAVMEKHGLSEGALGLLSGYDYPGNVRELENAIERAVALSRGEHITLDSLPPGVSQPSRVKAPDIPLEGMNLDDVLADYERSLLDQALRQSNRVKKRAAHLLGISFRSFRYRLEKLGLEDDLPES